MHFRSEFVPSSLTCHDVFVHSGSPSDPIFSQLLRGVSVDLDTYKVYFDYVFEAQMGMAYWALALSVLSMWPSQCNLRCFKREETGMR